ncbi:MAG: L-dopachrome tautomerase-related protein [Phycisphaerae bacterium]
MHATATIRITVAPQLAAAILANSALAQNSTPPPREMPTLGDSALTVFTQMTECPGNIAVTPSGRVIVSTHQFIPSQRRVVEVSNAALPKPFPNAAWNRSDGGADTFDTVLGLRCDSRGVVWMLDNGMRGKVTPKIVAWDTKADKLARVIYLPPPITVANSFVNDLQIDEAADAIYIADPAGGKNAAIIVVDLATGLARRVLEGDVSVAPEDKDLLIDGVALEIAQPDGTKTRPRIGVNPIALDHINEWLYFGPMSGSKLYRVKASDLRNAALSPADLAKRVEPYADRPFSDGISIDNAGNIYISAIADNAIGVIDASRKYRALIRGEQISWPDAFSFGPDGLLYVVVNQLHRSPPLNGGKNMTVPPFTIGTFKPLAPGVVGR